MHAYLPAILTVSLVVIGLTIVMTPTITTITSATTQLRGFFSIPAAVAATAISGPYSSSSDDQFSARLTGDNEVPPVDTDATGRIRLVVNSAQDVVDYQISLSNLNGIVTGAHIHRGSAGTNGPIVANLNIGGAFASASAGDGSASASTSSGGTITSADLKGPLAGKQVSELIKLIEDGKAYVNVHTRQHQNGEIRGQLTTSSSSSDLDNDGNNGISASSGGGASATASATAP
jgi:hypothetical protein